MIFQAFFEALQSFLGLEIWLILFIGAFVGIIFGIIPGLGSIVAMAVFLPLVFFMTPDQALPLFIAICATGYTGGSVTAILLNIPGTSPNAATLIDGYPMTQKGEGARALGAALMSSAMGGMLSVFLALGMVPLVLPLIFAITSADMVFIVLIGISFIAVLSKGSMIKGLLAGCIGILISFIGHHVTTGLIRFSFGTIYLIDGLPLIGLTLGLYAIPEMISLAARGGSIAKRENVVLTLRGTWEGAKDVFRHWGLWLRSSVIGYIIGIIPGVGAMTSIFVAYGQAKHISKHPEKFGTGIVEGVIAPESANNGKEGGALLTTLALGIPGSAEMVVLLGAFLMLGIRPGPSMMTQYLPLSFKLIQILFIGSLIGGVVCFFLAPRLARVAMIPARILVPLVIVLVFVGTFSHQEQLMDLVVLLVFGLIGLAMKKYGFNRPALLLGWVLGNLFEKYLFIAYGTGGPLFFVRPISLTLIAVLLGLFLFQPVKKLIQRRSAMKDGRA